MKPLSYILEDKKYTFDPEKEFKARSIGIISASRGHLSPEENAHRTQELHNDLKKAGHHIVKVQGSYTENYGKPDAKDVGEDSFIVMHPHKGDDHGYVFGSLNKLAMKYDQDSILHKPYDSESADLVGTNETGYPGLGKREPQGKYSNEKGEFFSKLEDGRTFSFKH